MSRPDWDEYFMAIARAVARRGTCDRLQVGAVFTLENRILATGYNGAPAGWLSCDEVGHEIVAIDGRSSCMRTIHAEENALLVCVAHGVAVAGATLYTTASTCYDCFKRVAQAKVQRIVYAASYTSARSAGANIEKLAAWHGIELVHRPSETAA